MELSAENDKILVWYRTHSSDVVTMKTKYYLILKTLLFTSYTPYFCQLKSRPDFIAFQIIWIQNNKSKKESRCFYCISNTKKDNTFMLLQVFSRYQQKEHWMIYFFFWSVQNQCRVPKAARYVWVPPKCTVEGKVTKFACVDAPAKDHCRWGRLRREKMLKL